MDLNTSLKVKTMKKGQIRKIYRQWMRWDFPPAERRPLRRILKFVAQKKYECLGLWRGEEQVGYAFLALDGRGGALLDYYAMAPACRGKGYGSTFFPLIACRYPAGILAEVESPEKTSCNQEKALRCRRVEFYRRLGMKDTGLRCLLYGIPYEILWHPGCWKQEELHRHLDGFYRQLMTPLMYRENLRYEMPDKM